MSIGIIALASVLGIALFKDDEVTVTDIHDSEVKVYVTSKAEEIEKLFDDRSKDCNIDYWTPDTDKGSSMD